MDVDPEEVIKWVQVARYPTQSAAEIDAAFLRSEGVGAVAMPISDYPGHDRGSRLLVDSELEHRALWLLKIPPVDESEPEFLATGEFPVPIPNSGSDGTGETPISCTPPKKRAGRKIILLTLLVVASLGAGYWLGDRHANKEHEWMFIRGTYLRMQDQIKVTELIYAKDYDKAIKMLERRLNVDILVLGPNPYHPRPLDDVSRSALRLTGDHREKYPYEDSSPGVNKMIKKALQCAK